MKKTVSIILAAVLIVAALPFAAAADEAAPIEFYEFADLADNAVTCDLNLDGSPDTLQTEIYAQYWAHFNLIINGKRFTFAVVRHGGYDKLAIADIDPSDSFLDIIVLDSYKGYIGATILRYDGTNLLSSDDYTVINEPLSESEDDIYMRYERTKVTTGDGTIIFECCDETHHYEALNEFTVTELFPVYLNGSKLEFDQPPVRAFSVESGGDRILVPLRAIFEALGATVEWEDVTRTAIAVKGDTTVTLAIDSNILCVNDEEIELDMPARLINDRTLVPVRAISEAFDCTVDWNEENFEVYITQ